LINPELTESKLKVTTSDAPDVHMSETLITGQVTGVATIHHLNPDGSVDEASTSRSHPITSELVRSAPTEPKIDIAITSMATGERLDLPDAELKTHGVD
jgi:hypothetical protein